MKSFLRFSLAAVLAFTLFGCGSTKDSPGSQDIIAQLTIVSATEKIIEAGSDPVARATKIHNFATEARSLLSNEAVSLPLLETAIRERLTGENLSPSDQILADALIRAITLELSRRVGSEHLSPDKKLTVDKVLGWVIDAAALTLPAKPGDGHGV